MALDNLREFVAAIDKAGDLTRVTRPVSVDKEITEVADRCMKSPGGGPALLFTQPTLRGGGTAAYPAAANLFGSQRGMALALGVAFLDHIAAPIARDGGARRDQAGRDRVGRGPGEYLCGLRPAAAHDRRIPVRRLPARRGCTAREGRDLRSRGPGRGRDRDRGADRSARRAGARGTVRRSHRVLLARRLLP